MLYIRHGQKAYNNGDAHEYSLDPGLTDHGKETAKIKFHQLIKTYGIPQKIIASPYLRTRETANIAQEMIITLTGKRINISYDRMLGECIKVKYNNILTGAFHPETLTHRPIATEYDSMFKERVYMHARSATIGTWYITHGYNIQCTAMYKGIKIDHPGELCGIRIDGNKVSII